MSSRQEKRLVEPPLLFISYSHVTGDDECRKRLRIHLKPLVRGNVLRVFDDTELTRDVGWRQQLLAKLNEAELVLMLVSPDFLASDFCFVEEWPVARKRWKATKAIVTFALIEPCQWKETDIGQLQGVPTHGKLLPDDHRGAAHFWDDIMGKLRKDANTMNVKAAAPAKNSLRPRPQPFGVHVTMGRRRGGSS